jgi:hypothetical protein
MLLRARAAKEEDFSAEKRKMIHRRGHRERREKREQAVSSKQ